jgi:predicted transcriptional regulator
LDKKYSLIYRAFTFNMHIFDKRYRSSFEIVALILKTSDRGASQFAIAKRLKTNYVLLHRYLNYLIRIGFIDVVSNGKQNLYKTSEKGFEFLRLYCNLLKMLYSTAEVAPFKIVCSRVMDIGRGRGRRSFGL